MLPKTDILLVEDDRDLLEFAGELLIELGYQVFTTSSAENALIFLENEVHLGLLLSDIRLPGSINGIELAKRAVEQQPNIKVILTSGYMEHPPNITLQDGFSFIEKPYRLAELNKAVYSILGGNKN